MSKSSSSQKRTNESLSSSSCSKRAKSTSAAFAWIFQDGHISKYFILPTSKIQLIIPEIEYEGESTDWATLSRIGVVCKDWNREMNLVSYDTIIRPPTDAALIAQIKSSQSKGGPRLIDLTSCDKITDRSIKYIELCTNLRVLIYRGGFKCHGMMTHERLTLRCIDEINLAVDALCEKSESRIEKLLVTPQNLGVKDI